MNLEVVLPILIPLTAGALSLALWRSVQLQRLVGVVATALLLAASIWLMRSPSPLAAAPRCVSRT